MSYIYLIENDINNKKYVGKTNFSIEKRFKEHLEDSTKIRKEKRPLYNAIQKYGKEHFSIKQLEEVSVDIANEREQYWINYYNSYNDGYNATMGGDGKTYLNYKKILNLFDTTLLSKKEIAKECNCCEDSVDNIVKQYRENVDWIKRFKDFQLNQPTKNNIKILCIEKNIIFNSIYEATQWLIDNKKISSFKDGKRHLIEVCENKRHTIGKYHWKYI